MAICHKNNGSFRMVVMLFVILHAFCNQEETKTKYMKLKQLFLSSMLALFSLSSAQAKEFTEGFESVTLVNADTWGRATELSNGWKIQGGYIGTSKDSYDYGFWTTAHDGSKSLTAQYGGTNNAFVIIPSLLTGDVTFYYRKTSTSSSTAGKVYAYKVTENNGTYTIGSRIFMDESATSSWQQCTSIKLTEPTMIAFKMVRAAMDDVVYSTVSSEPHEHSYDKTWSSDENEHWHACTSTTGVCDAKKTDVAPHDGLTCSVCGYESFAIRTLPWTEDFESISSGIPTGWDNSEGTTTTASYKWNYYGKAVRFDSYNNSEGKTNVLATPYILLPATGNFELRFKVKNPTGGNYEVKIGEYGSEERTTLFDNLTNIADWTEKTVSLAAYAGKTVRVYFCGTSNWGSGDAYLYLDDVTVKESIAHNHNYAEEWSHDYNNHWHACTSEIGECDAPQADFAAHTLNADGICTVCGYDQPYFEDFENGIPASWTNKGWTIDTPSKGNGTKMAFAGSGYSAASNTLVSPNLSAKAGEVLEFQTLQLWDDEYLTMEYSTDMGETWTEAIHVVPAANNTLHKLQFAAPADGIYQFRFSGAYNYIDNVCGFKLAQIPTMAVSTTAGATKEGNVFTDNFGRQTENASHTYTVKNTGAGTLVVNIASDNADFTVSEATLEMGAGESKTFDVTFVHSSTFGAKSAAITIVPTFEGLATVTINATANCADPEGFFEDFESGIPTTWQNTGWSIQTKNGSKMVYSYTSDDYKLTTPRLQAVKDDVLSFDAFQQWDDEPLKLEYSTDGGYIWTTAFEEAPAANNTARQFTFTAPADGYYYLRFSGAYNYIDNVSGFKLAPVVLEESELALTYKWSTLCYPANVTVSEGVQAYTVSEVNDDALVLEEVTGGTINAGTPVLLYSETGASQTLPAVTLPYLMNQPVKKGYSDLLVGCYGAMQLDDSKQYVLQAQNGVVAFYKVDPAKPFTTAAFRCYLEFSKPQSAPRLTFGGEFGTETSIGSVSATVMDGKIYDLDGREAKALRKGGIYIVNNKKMIIK